MIAVRAVTALGVAQLISWGTSYYLVGAFGEQIAIDLGWSRGIVYGGFALALLVMGLVSPAVGGLIDRRGGRAAMVAGSLLNATGCLLLAACHSLAVYGVAWVCLGLAMRLTLYDAAFAALARLGGAAARRPMSQITLIGGLSSTTFWPLGHLIATQVGWRGALVAYAGFALLTVPLHLMLPAGRAEPPAATPTSVVTAPRARERRDIALASVLYAASAGFTNFLNAGLSAHMIGLLGGLGVTAGTAVAAASLRGVGQSSARGVEVVFGRRLDATTLNLLASALLPLAFVAAFFAGRSDAAAMAFAFGYGAGNGLLTITRGTLPLVLFDPATYGSRVGRLLVPSFVFSAAAPVVYAAVIDRFGHVAAVWLSLATGVLALASALAIARRFAPPAALTENATARGR